MMDTNDIVAKDRQAAVQLTTTSKQRLSADFSSIRAEGMQLADGSVTAPPYGLDELSDGNTAPMDGHPVGWRNWCFYRHNQRYDSRCEQMPETAKVADIIAEQIPYVVNITLLVLEPGTVLPKHADPTNFFVNWWMGLIVPDQCGLEVAGKACHPSEGQCLGFNNSYFHRAWNHSDVPRIVLASYCSHFELSLTEQRGMALLMSEYWQQAIDLRVPKFG